MTRLRDKVADAEASSRLGLILSGGAGRHLEPIEVLGQPALLRLLERREEEEVALELAAWLRDQGERAGFTPELLTATGQMPLSSRMALAVVARAVRDPDRPDIAFGTLEEWSRLPDVEIGRVHRAYQDLEAKLDPFAVELPEAEVAAMVDAVKKNDRHLLISFGAARLTALLLASDVRPASSATPK